MLVLGRRVSESIQIGEDILIKILGFDRGTIHIGIEAPKEISIVRTELLDRKEKKDV